MTVALATVVERSETRGRQAEAFMPER